MKSIKEISEIIGISKVSLYKLIKKPELKEHIKKEYNTTFVDEVGEQIIKEYYACKQSMKSCKGRKKPLCRL